MKRKRRPKNTGAPKWMVTYSDMITLVLVFFILLFSMSQIDTMKFEQVTESFKDRGILDFLPSAIDIDDTGTTNDDGDGEDAGDDDESDDEGEDEEDFDASGLHDYLEEWEKKEDALARLMEDVDIFLEEEGLTGAVTANRTEEGVVLVLQDSILFDPGEAEVLEQGQLFLDEIGGLLEGMPNNVRIEGHTDTRPIANYRYPSNWELSGARASSVIRYLIDEFDIDDGRFSLIGYGEVKPVAKNDTDKNRAKNRRVEIIILDQDAEKDE